MGCRYNHKKQTKAKNENKNKKQPTLSSIKKLEECCSHWLSIFNTINISLKIIYITFTAICFSVKEKEDLHPDPEVQSVKDETFGEYR